MSYSDFINALTDDDIFEEKPADLKTFLYDEDYMKLPRLSQIQEDIVERGSQIYSKETILKLYGEEEARRLEKLTTRDVFLLLGKGSGKDFISQITCLYIVHKLLCLKDPAAYYGKPEGDSIDIVNMAINANQAKRVFFDGLVTRMKRCSWFRGKHETRRDDVAFDKNVNLFSMHSSFEAAEGLNILVAVLDELDGFSVEGQAAAIYKALSGTVSSRFAENGKVVVLSFPRKKDGFMMQKYDDAVLDKETHEYEHVFKLKEDLPDGTPGNELRVVWTEETVTGYRFDNFYALKAPTFRVNPTKKIEDYKRDFMDDLDDTLMRVCANPPDADQNAFFRNHSRITTAFAYPNGWYDEEVDVIPDGKAKYYIHADLARQHDRAAVSMAHVEGMQTIDYGEDMEEHKPAVVVDLLRYWIPRKNEDINLVEIRDFIVELCQNYNVARVTFDQWGSYDMIKYLGRHGIKAEKFSLSRPEYNEFQLAINESRLRGPSDDELIKELKNLIIVGANGKVDHKPGFHNDLTEAVCGATVDAIRSGPSAVKSRILTPEDIADRQRQAEYLDQAKMEERLSMPKKYSSFLDMLQIANDIDEL